MEGSEKERQDAHPSLPDEDVARQHAIKQTEILRACERSDLPALRLLATSPNGFINDKARQSAWPLLLGCEGQQSSLTWQDLPRHKDEAQVALDVDRAFVYYPNDVSTKHTQVRREQLSDLILSVLRRNQMLNYFQGYHDIAQVFLLVLGSAVAGPAVERLSMLRIRDFMLPTMTASVMHLSLLPSILRAADAELYGHLAQTAPFYFALPATLTLYAHDIQEYGDIARLFDFLLATEAVISVYLFAVIICARKDELLQLEAYEHDMLHATLSKLPKPLNLDSLIGRTNELFAAHPPEKLRGHAWRSISQYSVLKTVRDSEQLSQQTLSDGAQWFRKHADQIKRQETRQAALRQLSRVSARYRGSIIVVGSSLAVAFISFYLVRNPALASTQSIRAFAKGYANLLYGRHA